jgi:hypothetical protein
MSRRGQHLRSSVSPFVRDTLSLSYAVGYLIQVIVAFILLLLTFFVGIICFKDFDQGLRAPKVQGKWLFLIAWAR